MQSLHNFQELPLATLSAAGSPPKSRLSDVAAATSLYAQLRKGDEASAINRTRVQGMFDGLAPYNDADLRSTGQGFRCNLNFGNAEAFLESAMSAYIDLINSVETMVTCAVTVGEMEQRQGWNSIIAEEATRTFRAWPKFNHSYLNLCNQFVAHGMGIGYYEDETDWRWQSTGLGDILIPRQTPACEEDLEVAVAFRPMTVNHLFARIENEAAATAVGWNIEEVKAAILKACSTTYQNDMTQWERMAAEIKNNDLYTGANSATVPLIHIWVQEFDGTVSHYISLADGTNKEFLLKAPSRYSSVGRAFVFFPYGIGTNGSYHSVRGLGYKIYPHIQVANRLRSQMIDSAMLASSVMIQPQDDRAMEAFSFNYMGPFALLSPGMNYVERSIPNMATGVMPVLEDMIGQMSERVGQYNVSSVFNQGSGNRTRFEVAAHLEAASKISVTALNLFYEPWERLLRESVRRLTQPNYLRELPGGAASEDFFRRCLERGVPPNVIHSLDHAKTRAVRSVGAGSQAQRLVSLQQLNEFSGAMDAEGRRRLQRDQAATLVGYEHADRYIPGPDGPRLPIDAKLAQLENQQLEDGADIQVLPAEMDVVHLDVHIAHMNGRVAAMESGELSLEDATRKVLPVFQHSVVHLENIQSDPTLGGMQKTYRDQLKSFGEILNNGLKHIQKIEKEQQKAAESEENASGNPENQISGEMQEKLTEHRLKLKMMEEQHQLKLSLALQEAEQKRRLKDAENAVDLRTFLK